MEKLLIVLAVVLGVIAIAQLAKAYELASKARKKKEEEISRADIKMNGALMLLFMGAFYAFFIWQVIKYSDVFMPPSASVHGESIDQLFDVNLIIITIAFFLTNTLLFTFAYKYQYRAGRKALYYPHNNKLELIWTTIPAIVLAGIIIFGLMTWNDIMDEPSDDALVVELYSEQFKWTVRYAGEDGKLGEADYNLISSTNAVGIVIPAAVDSTIKEVEVAIENVERKLMDNEFYNMMEKLYDELEHGAHDSGHGYGEEAAHAEQHENGEDHHHEEHNEMHDVMAKMPEYDLSMFSESNGHNLTDLLTMLDGKMDAIKGAILIDEDIDELNRKAKNLELHRKRLLQLNNAIRVSDGGYQDGLDDQLVTGEFHLPVNKEVVFKIRSKDVIHSAYMPHFRAQMNSVPGMTTSFKMTPKITTEEMKAQEGDDFEFILLCNKICGASHFNMQMKIIVESEEDYEAWVKAQKTFRTTFFGAPEAKEEEENSDSEAAKSEEMAAVEGAM